MGTFYAISTLLNQVVLPYFPVSDSIVVWFFVSRRYVYQLYDVSKVKGCIYDIT